MKKAIVIILSIMLVLTIISPAAAISTITVKSINLNNSKITMKVYESSKLAVTFSPENTSQTKLTFITSNKNVATVNSAGEIKGIHAGNVTITVLTLNKKVFAKCNVTVSEPARVEMRMAWWGSDARHKATLDAIKLYAASNPNVIINAEYQAFDSYQQKLFTSLAANMAPDIFQYDVSWSSQLSNFNDKKGATVNLYENKLVDTNLFDAKLLKETGVYEGKLLGIPVGLNADPSMLLNLDFMRKYGIPENGPMDWDNIIEYGKKIHAQDNDAYILYNNFNRTLLMYIQQKTGKMIVDPNYEINVTKEDIVDGLKFLKMLQDEGISVPCKQVLGYKNILECPQWQQGKIGIDLIPAAAFTADKVKGVQYKGSRFPIIKNAKDSSIYITATMWWGINSNTKNSNYAGGFLTWLMTNKYAVLALGDVRGPQPVNASSQILLEAGKLDKTVVDAITASSQKQGINWGTSKIRDAVFSKEFESAYQKVLLNVTTPEKAADDMLSAFKAAASEAKKNK